jgi:hypothetical protein
MNNKVVLVAIFAVVTAFASSALLTGLGTTEVFAKPVNEQKAANQASENFANVQANVGVQASDTSVCVLTGDRCG